MSDERVSGDFKKVVDLEGSRQDRKDVSVKLRTVAKQALMHNRRRGQAVQPVASEGDIAIMHDFSVVTRTIIDSCEEFKQALSLAPAFAAAPGQSPDPYQPLLLAAGKLNILATQYAALSTAHEAWTVAALMDGDVLPALSTCLEFQPLLRQDDDYALQVQVTDLLIQITAMATQPAIIERIARSHHLLFKYGECPSLRMRCQVLDCLGNMAAFSAGVRDTLIASGMVQFIAAQMALPYEDTSDSLWEAVTFALATLFQASPLPPLEVFDQCVPQLVKLLMQDELPGAVNAGIGAMSYIASERDKNYTERLAVLCDDKVLEKVVRLIIPDDYRNKLQTDNRVFALNLVYGFARDIPLSWGPLYKAGLMGQLRETLGGDSTQCVAMALGILEFAADAGGVQEAIANLVYHECGNNIKPQVLANKNVKMGLGALFAVSVCSKLVPSTHQQVLYLAEHCNMFKHIVEALKLSRFDATMGVRCLEAVGAALDIGATRTDPTSGTNYTKKFAEETDLVQVLHDIEMATDMSTNSTMATAILARHFDSEVDDRQLALAAPAAAGAAKEYKFSLEDVGTSGLTVDSFAAGLKALYVKNQGLQQPDTVME